MPNFTRSCDGEIPVGAEVVYEILTDYNTYGEWVPHVSKGRTLAVEGELAIAEFHLAGGAETLQMECIHSRNRQVIGRLLSGDTSLHKLEWNLQPHGAGCRVELSAEYRWTQQTLNPLSSKAFKAQELFDALKTHASAFSMEAVLVEGEKIIDLMETPDGLILWLRGKKYLCQPAPEEATGGGE